MINMRERLAVKINAALKPSLLEIIDNSAKHSHHQAMLNKAEIGGTHFAVKIVSDIFHGHNRINRHRLVTALLKDEFASGLHALELNLLTPEEIKLTQNS